ncbi:ATP-binding protein [Nocardia sp. NPDC059240]|uniref:ATP-binding protein n=1 Tax=Nocardia sp. NPDC059240 TaxID=3346786 RepID=UPI0036AB4427
MTLHFSGIPADLPAGKRAVVQSRLAKALEGIAERDTPMTLGVSNVAFEQNAGPERAGEVSMSERARQFTAGPPSWRLDQVVLPQQDREALLAASNAIRYRSKIQDEYGFGRIEPRPSVALNFHGEPGTGKTMAAHGFAHHLGLPILTAGYAEIESMYHGEGPKNVKALFHAAEQAGALLFVDEADSLLSRRLSAVTQGSEQAVNAMRNQIVLCLDEFVGVVVFATNLVENYDPAFVSRILQVHFTMPDHDARTEIWRNWLNLLTVPWAVDVDPGRLATATDGLSGRDMRNVLSDVLERAAPEDQEVYAADFDAAVTRFREATRSATPSARVATVAEQQAIESSLLRRGVLECDGAQSN